MSEPWVPVHEPGFPQLLMHVSSCLVAGWLRCIVHIVDRLTGIREIETSEDDLAIGNSSELKFRSVIIEALSDIPF